MNVANSKSFFLIILVDGIGLSPKGSRDPVRRNLPWLQHLEQDGLVALPAGGWASSTLAHLGVQGLPQSATGHTTILTGINAARFMGRHVPGFPTPSLRRMIQAHNLMGVLEQWGFRAEYLNAFAPMHPVEQRRGLKSAATIAALASGKSLRTLQDICEGKALYHEFTNGMLIRNGERLPSFTPKQAGRILARMGMECHMAFFEYFLTDLAGHAMDLQEACSQMGKIREFLEGVLEEADLGSGHVLICSDHGNLEDLSVRTHTRNPVPTMVWGPCAERLALGLQSIEHIAPLVKETMAPGKEAFFETRQAQEEWEVRH